MRKIALATVATLFVAFTTAPLLGSESKTEVSGPVSSATLAFLSSPVFLGTIAGLPIGDQAEVEWEPVVGGKGEIKNVTQNTQAECTAVAGTTPAPSNRLRCTVTES